MLDAVPAITSRRHPLVQAFRDARESGADTPLLIDGWHLLVEAVAAGVPIEVVAFRDAPPRGREADAVEACFAAGAHVVRVTPDILTATSPVRTPSGVVALARRPRVDCARVFQPSPALVLAALDVQDPGNLGALVRTAEAAGATGVVAVGATADPFGWKALRAAMGSTFRLPVARLDSSGRLLDEARADGCQVVALVPRGGASPDAVDLTGPTCLLLGGEGPGLSADLVAASDCTISVPMAAAVDSLNVAVAGALAVYGAARQRRTLV